MGPKKPKDPALDENFWRTNIEVAVLNEETWNVKIIFIEAAGSDQDRIYLNKFEIFAAEERRFVVKNICKTETIFMINQLGGEKKVKDENLRVFEEGQAFLKDKKDIPPDILAVIIKHLILKMKDEYLFIKSQKLEVREGMKRESATMINRAEVKGTVSVPPPVDNNLSPLPPKDKNKKEDADQLKETPQLTEGKKYNTSLRVRGEEWRDKIYVDDFPPDGPNLYVAITGFLEPNLAGCLIKIGVPITAIIQIRIDPSTVKVPSTLFRETKRGQSQTEILAAKCHKFWEDLQQLRIDKETCDDYKNTAFIVFSPPYWETEDLSGKPDKIYDELCYLLYDIQDLTRQHNHYLENMDIINIPNEIEEDYYCSEKKYYEQISELPLECVTIFSVMDGILQAVCSVLTTQMDDSINTTLSPVANSEQDDRSPKEIRSNVAENLVRNVFDKLCNTESEKKNYRITYGDEYERLKDPVVINFGDFAKYQTFQLGNMNMDNLVLSMLHGLPIFNLWQNQDRQSGELEAKINFHVNVLLSCFERKDVETTELNRLIHILACRKIYNNRSSLKIQHLQPSTISEFKKVYLKRTVLAEPLPAYSSPYRSWSSMSAPFASKVENDSYISDDDSESSRIKFLFDCPDISELVSAAEIASEKPINHMIDDFEFFEEFSLVSGFQTMVDAFNTFNCLDYKYCEVTDCLILMFFNSHDKDGVSREEWRCHLPTPLCLQDFFDFVMDEHYDWIKKEEEIYAQGTIQRSQSIYKNDFELLGKGSCIDNTQVDADLLIEGSLKYQDLANIEQASPEATETKTKTTSISPSSTDVPSKSSRKTKSAVSTPKNIKQSFLESSTSTVNIPKKPFSGYDLSDRRVEIFGKDSCFFSKDGTKVLTKYKIMIPGNSEYIMLKVIPGNNNFTFWMHKALGEVESHIIDTCESFRITSRENLLIYVKKQSFEMPLSTLPLNISCTEKLLEKQTQNINLSKQVLKEKVSFYSLNITWPNGLITETVHETNSVQISHIKQYYITSMSNIDEDMRCISLNGDVIIFKSSNPIEIFRPDGTYIQITNCEKKNTQEVFEDPQSDASSDKSKKGKGKEKNKPSKSSSKSSKTVIDNDDKDSDIKLPVYELFINEFEIIEANGFKQKWVNDTPQSSKKLLIRTATDFCSGEIFSRRMDGTSTLLNKDGIHMVTFPDGTRIITTIIIDEEEIYPEWTDEEIEYFTMFESDTIETGSIKSKKSLSQQSREKSFRQSTSVEDSTFKNLDTKDESNELKNKERTDGYISIHAIFTIEHKNFTTVTINKANNTISIKSPNDVGVEIDSKNNYKFTLDSATTADFNSYDLNIRYKACVQCHSYTSCMVKIKNDDELSSATNFNKWWLKMEDSFNTKISVNDEGNIRVLDDTFTDEEPYEKNIKDHIITEEEDNGLKFCEVKSKNSLGKCSELHEAKAMRFFVLRRQLTCSELEHRAVIDQYKENCRWQPWCSINQFDTFGDNRNIVSILSPLHLTESEKWLMESQYTSKPKNLTYKDLKKDSGKGFYHWMRPYERFQPTYREPESVVSHTLPRAFILRNLEQQWGEDQREQLKGGKELLTAILRYRRLMEADSDTILYVPIRDPRPPDERRIDDIIQAIAARTFEDLKCRVTEDVQKRAKATITTKPSIPVEDTSLDGELEEIREELDILEEKRASTVQEVETAEMSENLKRYWRRRAEELKEEQFYKYLLREGSVPPYFRNVLGGAIWWEINNLAGEAATKAERRRMKCVCEPEDPGESSTREPTEQSLAQ